MRTVFKCSASGCSSGQTRSFVYDAPQRRTQATNPESGTYSYSYTDANRANRLALQSRTHPRNYKTTYSHNAMDWLTGIAYGDGTSNASFTYNALGNVTQSKNGNVTNNYTSFDGDGRVTASNLQMQGQTYPLTYQYDLAGNLKLDQYPSGRTLNTTFEITGRPQTVNGVASGATTNYVQLSGYYPDGQAQFRQYGSGLWSWQSVDSMLRPWQAWATMNNDGNKWMFIAYNGFDLQRCNCADRRLWNGGSVEQPDLFEWPVAVRPTEAAVQPDRYQLLPAI